MTSVPEYVLLAFGLLTAWAVWKDRQDSKKAWLASQAIPNEPYTTNRTHRERERNDYANVSGTPSESSKPAQVVHETYLDVPLPCFKLLEAIVLSNMALTVGPLSEGTRIPKSSCDRHLKALLAGGYVKAQVKATSRKGFASKAAYYYATERGRIAYTQLSHVYTH